MWLLFGLSLGLASPPDNVDLSLIDKWNDGAEAMLDGTNGCWELVGHAKWNWQFGRFGETRGEAVFAGRLQEGFWTAIHIEPLGEVRRRGSQPEQITYGDERRFNPLVGKLRPRKTSKEEARRRGDNTSREPRNVLRVILDEVGSLVSTSWASWDEERLGVVYHTSVPLREGARSPEVNIEAFFPGGGNWATEQDIVFPETFRLERPFAPIIHDAKVSLRARIHDNLVFPTGESFRFGFRVLGFEMSGAQSIDYTHATRCSGW